MIGSDLIKLIGLITKNRVIEDEITNSINKYFPSIWGKYDENQKRNLRGISTG